MKKSLFFCIVAMVFAGCNRVEIEPVVEMGLPSVWAGVDVSDTKAYVDEGLAMHWNANDKIDVSFANDTYQNAYVYTFSGADGATEGEFTPPSGSSIEPSYGKDVAYFPSGRSTAWSASSAKVRLWEYQTYAEGSFGATDNPMIALSTEKDGKLFFPFKNVCGYLVVRLYGDVSVTEVTLEGNNGEILAGECYVIMGSDGIPFIARDDSLFKETWISVAKKVNNVVTPLKLGKTAEEATEIWFVVPPTTFKKGFTITILGSDDEEMVISTPRQRSITRNVVNKMAPIEVVFDEDFEDAKFRAYCYDSFDTDKDGELSEEEALAVTEIDCRGLGISSLKGISRFKNLEVLRCGMSSKNESGTNVQLYNSITGSLDLSKFPKLEVVDCSQNSIESLNLSGLTKLDSLVCSYNLITSLDVSELESLTMLSCSNNKLTSLDVSMLVGLESLNVSDNDLPDFDYSNNTSLTSLHMIGCGLTSVDVSMLPDLLYLGVSENHLGSLDVSHNPELYDLNCMYCDLSELDITTLTKLNSVNCGYNSIKTLDVTHNTELGFIFAQGNGLESISLCEKNTKLWMVNVYDNKLSGEFDLSNSKDTKLFMLTLGKNAITKLWLPEGFTGYFSCDIKDTIEIDYK